MWLRLRAEHRALVVAHLLEVARDVRIAVLDASGCIERGDDREITSVQWGELMRSHVLDSLSSGERTIVVLAHDFWSDANKVSLLEVVRRLSDDKLSAVLYAVLLQRGDSLWRALFDRVAEGQPWR